MLIKKGAEANIYLDDFSNIFYKGLNQKLIIKERIAKSYRNEKLDLKLRKSRTYKEAKLLHEMKKIGLNVPLIYYLDEYSMICEYISDDRLKDIIDSIDINEVFQKLGEDVAKMHKAGIIHGDLTTSNILIKDGNLYFIDFGLGSFSEIIEDQGVDLLLFQKAVESTHYQYYERAMKYFYKGYSSFCENIDDIFNKIEEIENRGRYRIRKQN